MLSFQPITLEFAGTHRNGKRLARVAKDYPYRVWERVGIIPAGFETDLESVPRWCQWMMPRAGKGLISSIIHDYEIQRAGAQTHEANRVMIQALAIEGFTDLRRPVIAGALWLRVVAGRALRQPGFVPPKVTETAAQ